MNSYVDFDALGQTLIYSLAAVILVVGSFSVGARTYVAAAGARAAARPATARFAVAMVCFAVAASAVGTGVWFILDK